MSHSRHRVSRSLVVALTLTIVLLIGLSIYLWRRTPNGAANQTAQSPAGGNPPATAPAAEGRIQAQLLSPPEERVVRTETPTAAPAAKPAAAADPKRDAEKQAPAEPAAGTAPANKPRSASKPAAKLPPHQVLTEAKKKQEAGDLLAARDILNNALADLDAVGQEAARSMLREINQEVVYSARRFTKDPFGGTYAVQSGDWLAKIARNYSVTPELLMRLNNLTDPRRLRAGSTIKIIRGPFHAVVSKKDFRLDLYLGGTPDQKPADPADPAPMYVASFPVGLGENDSTPTGRWTVKPDNKIKNPTYYSPRGEGVIEGDDPKNPLGEYWIGLEGVEGNAVGQESYGVHGTIEPETIGKQASLGCIRLRNEDVAAVFEALVESKSTVLVKE